jgi:hypothetical protein
VKTLLMVMAGVVVAGAMVWLLYGGGVDSLRVGERVDVRPIKPPAVAWTADGGVADASRIARLYESLANGPQPTVGWGAEAKAAATTKGVEIEPQATGAFEWSGLYFQVVHFDSKWAQSSQGGDTTPDRGYPRRNDGWELSGVMQTRSGAFAYQQRVTRVSDTASVYEAVTSSDVGITSSQLALEVSLPVTSYSGETLIVDGRPLVLEPGFWQTSTDARVVQIATKSGTVVLEGADGPIKIVVQDNKRFGSANYSVRLEFAPGSGVITQGRLKLVLHGVRGK